MSSKRRHRDAERGVVATEAAIAFPLILALAFAVVQGSLWFTARSMAMGAAQEGARAASAEQPESGVQRATDFMNSLPMVGLLDSFGASQSQTTTRVTVTVTAQVPNVIPGVPIKVSQTATSPRERFTDG
jgi:Flp pilus assembly protein TadG